MEKRNFSSAPDTGRDDSLENLFIEFMQFSQATYPEATQLSTLNKLREEITELSFSIQTESQQAQLLEYVDCFMCLLHSLAAAGITTPQLYLAFGFKLDVNKKRNWIFDPETKTYSHDKS